MNLYHYYDKTIGPFKSLSDMDDEEAKNRILSVQNELLIIWQNEDIMKIYFVKNFRKKVELLNGFHHITWWWNKVSG